MRRRKRAKSAERRQFAADIKSVVMVAVVQATITPALNSLAAVVAEWIR
ncbi:MULTISPECIES: hypothetical protein [unclassified Streptomyces]